MDPIVIELGSQAWRRIAAATDNPDVYKISILPRLDGVAIKINENTWSPTLRTDAR